MIVELCTSEVQCLSSDGVSGQVGDQFRNDRTLTVHTYNILLFDVPYMEGLLAVHYLLNKCTQPITKTNTEIRLEELVLTLNPFEFNGE